jgi:hypothetical protein
MQMIGALLAPLFGGGTAAAATAGTAAAAGAAGASVGSSALTFLQGVGSVFGALTTIGSGAAAAVEGQNEKAQQDFAAKDEYIQGQQTSAALKAELAKTISNQAVAFAAGGVNLGSVSVGEARKQATSDAESQLSLAGNQALLRELQRKRAGRMAAMQGNAAAIGSIFKAGTQIAQFGVDVLQRG